MAQQPAPETAPAPSPAEREVVVTASRIETPLDRDPHASTIITERDITARQQLDVVSALRDVPGLHVVQTGGAGGVGSVFMRGANSDHTLVLVDGIEANNSMSVARAFDFAQFTTDNIARIEVIRGPQSVLYGSNAMGGVINIITRRGEGDPRYRFSLEAGSLNTWHERATLDGGSDRFHYAFALSRFDSRGIPSADDDAGNPERDGLRRTGVSLRLGGAQSEHLDTDVTLRYIDSAADIDNGNGPGADDPNHRGHNRDLYLATRTTLASFDGAWMQTIKLGLTDHRQAVNNDSDAAHPGETVDSSFSGRFMKLDWQHEWRVHQSHTLVAGLEYEDETGDSDYRSDGPFGPFVSTFSREKAKTTGVYAEDHIVFGEAFWGSAGLRYDQHRTFGSAFTWRIASSYAIAQTQTRLKGSYGTGFKAPSLYQLFSQYGTEDLDPEESSGWDLGVEQDLFNQQIGLGLSWFANDFSTLIDFDGATSHYQNVPGMTSHGLEAFARYRPSDFLTARIDYTYTETRRDDTTRRQLRRPRHKLSGSLATRWSQDVESTLTLSHVGSRDDNYFDLNSFAVKRVELNDYTLVNCALSWNALATLRLFGRVENLLDQDYQEAWGYSSTGIAFYAGLEATF